MSTSAYQNGIPSQVFYDRLQGFLSAANKIRAEHQAKNWPTLPATQPLTVDPNGKRYLRIVKLDSGRSVYCFIDTTNGDVLKAEGWKKPAKHARSNLFDADYGASGVTHHGGAYLK